MGDKLTITRDEPRVLPRMLFTDNDIVRDTLEIDYALSDEAWADGMVGEYVDETTWRLAEVSSAPDGVTLLKPARVQLEGVVNRKQATGMVRMMAAESQYRRITVSWTARMEGRLLKRGDLVRITTEEPETWGQSCEVLSFDPSSLRLVLDPPPEWAASGNHFVEIRCRDGSPWGPVRVPPQPSDGEDGDYWVVERTGQSKLIYGPKEGGEWPAQPSSTFGVGGIADVPGLGEVVSRLDAQAYATRAAAQAEKIPAPIGLIRTLGFYASGDGGGTDYRRAKAGEVGRPSYSFTDAAGALWVPASAALNIRWAGAKGDGVADDLVYFRDAPFDVRVIVPPGLYRLSSDVLDRTRRFEFPLPGGIIAGPGLLVADLKSPYLSDVQRPTYGSVSQDLTNSVSTLFQYFGDSLPWGLGGDGQGNFNDKGNGYAGGGARSSITIPRALQNSLRSAFQYNTAGGNNITVRNMAFPGDHAFELLKRVQVAAAAIRAGTAPKPAGWFFQIGTNDAIDSRSVADYAMFLRMAVEIGLDLGILITLVLPPEWPQAGVNARLQAFRSAMKETADAFNLLCVDMRDQLAPLGSKQWVSSTDGHLSTPGYELGGWDLAALFAAGGLSAPMRLGPGLRITAGDFPIPGYGGHINNNAYIISRDGSIIQIDPNYTGYLSGYVEADCVPLVETVNPDSNTTRHLTYQLVGKDTLVMEFSDPPASGIYRRGFTPPMLRRGYRQIGLKASGGAAAFFDAITGYDPHTHTQGPGGIYYQSELTGARRPLAFGTPAWFRRDSYRVAWGHHIWFYGTLDAAGGTGVSLMGGEDTNLPYGSRSQVMALRDGSSLIIRDLLDSRPDVVIANVFPATGLWTGEIHIEITHPDRTQANCIVYVNGDGKGQRLAPLSTSGGYPAIVATAAGIIACDNLYVNEG